MDTHIYFTLLDKDNNDLTVLSLAIDLPHRLTVGESLVVDEGGWELSVETVKYDLVHKCWLVEFEPYASPSIDEALETESDFLSYGWKHCRERNTVASMDAARKEREARQQYLRTTAPPCLSPPAPMDPTRAD